MITPRTNPELPTIAEMVSAHKGGRHLASLGVVAARFLNGRHDEVEAIMADGSGVHQDRIQARCFNALHNLAWLCEVDEQAAAF